MEETPNRDCSILRSILGAIVLETLIYFPTANTPGVCDPLSIATVHGSSAFARCVPEFEEHARLRDT